MEEKKQHLFVERLARPHNSTYPQAGVSCCVGQESSKFEVQSIVGNSVVKIPACGLLQNVGIHFIHLHEQN